MEKPAKGTSVCVGVNVGVGASVGVDVAVGRGVWLGKGVNVLLGACVGVRVGAGAAPLQAASITLTSKSISTVPFVFLISKSFITTLIPLLLTRGSM